MSPSSLIFVAVIAIWAAYLVIETSRRREYLATARTVDRFSASMRVLQRRAVRRESAEAFEASTAPMRRTSSVLLHRGPEVTARAAAKARAEVLSAPVASGGGTAALVTRQRSAAQVRRARVLAVAALVSALAAVVTAVLAGLGFVSWVAPVSGVLLSALLVVELRRRARLSRQERRSEAHTPARPVSRRAAHTTAAPAAASTAIEVEDTTSEVLLTPIRREYRPFDYAREVEPVVAADRSVRHRDPLLGDEGWQPVPVPPPTYTLKARAEHPVPEPLVVEHVPEFTEEAWDQDQNHDYVTYGRAAGE